MLDTTAIKELQKAAAIQEVNSASSKAIQSALENGEKPIVFLPDNFTSMDLEKFLAGRVRYRAAVKTNSIPAFVSYMIDGVGTHGHCFIDVDSMTAKGFLNLGDRQEAGHADDTAELKLKKTSEFQALLKLAGDQTNQLELAHWIEDWAPHLKFSDADGVELTVKEAVTAIRKITINQKASAEHSAEDFRASKSAFEQIEANMEGKRPEQFTFTCIPFEGLEEHTFSCRISVLTTGEKISLRIRIRRLDAELECVGQAFSDLLNDELGDRFKTYLGQISV